MRWFAWLSTVNLIDVFNLCINCERQMEKYPGRQYWSGKGNWDQVIDSDAPLRDQRISLTEMEMSLSSNR